MNELPRISDEKSLEAWLQTRPQEDAVLIAHRVAMRVAPLWIEAVPSLRALRRDLNSTPVLRLNLTSGVARKYPTPEVRNAALAAAAADTAFASSSAADTAFASASSALRKAIEFDVHIIFSGDDLESVKLWPEENPLAHEWQASIPVLRDTPGSEFWIDWYQRALDGRPQNWPLLRDIALIDDGLWTGDPADLNVEIRRLVAQHNGDEPTSAPEAITTVSMDEVMRGAIAGFRFDQMDYLMRMVPFAEDVRHLADPEKLGSFLSDAKDTARSLKTLLLAIEKEAGKLQGAGWISVYITEVLDELSHARDAGRLNVGAIVEYGRILQEGIHSQEIGAEIGTLVIPLRNGVEKLRALTLFHFAHTLSREATLRQIRSDPKASLYDLLEDLRKALNEIKESDPAERVPLARDGIEILRAFMDNLEQQVRAEALAPTAEIKVTMRQEIDFLMAKVAVSMTLYAQDAKQAIQTAERGAKFSTNIVRGAGALEVVVGWLKRMLNLD